MKAGNHLKQVHLKHDEEEVRAALRGAFPAVDTEPLRDLWPAMLRRMEEAAPAARVPWYDWALAIGLAAAVVVFPKCLLLFAYHL